MKFTTLGKYFWLANDGIFFSDSLFDDVVLGSYYSNLTQEIGRFDLALVTPPMLQVNRLTKCAS